ncbi:MAG: hypothetical protein ACRDIC_07215 [bacterium]
MKVDGIVLEEATRHFDLHGCKIHHGLGGSMKQLVALEATLERVDGDDFASLPGRIAFQKRIYLVQVAGVDLGYRFSWNQYGPYSPDLAQDRVRLEARRDDIRESLEQLRMRKGIEAALDEVKGLIQKPKATALTDAEWLELLSSLHYLSQTKHTRSEGKEEQLEQDLVTRKPHLKIGAEDLDEAWQRLRSLESLSNS